jgi:hypothetical protein
MESDTPTGLDPNGAFKKIFKDPSWKLVLGVGSIVNAATLVLLTSGRFALPLLPVAFLVWAASQGYILKVARTVIKSPDETLPQWSGWADMMISGLTWLAITCTQIIVFFSVLYFSLVFGSWRNWLNALTPQFAYWAYGTIFAEFLVLFLGAFFFPLLMANFAEKERASAALAVKSALNRLYRKPEQFVLLWLLSTGLYAIAVLLPMITVVGVVLIPLTTFIASLANTIMLGQVWRAADATVAAGD